MCSRSRPIRVWHGRYRSFLGFSLLLLHLLLRSSLLHSSDLGRRVVPIEPEHGCSCDARVSSKDRLSSVPLAVDSLSLIVQLGVVVSASSECGIRLETLGFVGKILLERRSRCGDGPFPWDRI